MSWAAVAGAAVGVVGGAMASKGSKQAGTINTQQSLPQWQLENFLQPALWDATRSYQSMDKSTPLLGPSQNEYLKTIQGGYLSPQSNPFLKQTFDQAAQGVTDAYSNVVQPRTDSAFFGPGSLQGNTAYGQQVQQNQIGLGRGLSELASNIYGNNYQQERMRQFGATSAAPQFTSGAFQAQSAPYSNYIGMAGNAYGSSNTQPYFNNPTAGALGGGLLGYQLGNMYNQNQRTQSPQVDYGWLGAAGQTGGAYGY